MGIGIGLFSQAVYSDYKTTSGDELKSPTSSANTAARPRRNWQLKTNEAIINITSLFWLVNHPCCHFRFSGNINAINFIFFYWVCTWLRGKLRCDTERFAHNRWLVSLL
jgi:hypothetical protein